MIRSRASGAHPADPPPAASRRYRLGMRPMAPSDDQWIEDGLGQPIYRVEVAAVRPPRTLVLEAVDRHRLYWMQERVPRIRDILDIEGAVGTVATVRKSLVAPLCERYVIELPSGAVWAAEGDIADLEYTISAQDGPVANVSRRRLRARDTYGIEVTARRDDALVLMVAMAIDELARPAR